MEFDYETHGYKLVKADDDFYFDCTACGDCCRNVKDSVMVDSLDLYRLAKFLGMEMSHVISQYTTTVFLARGFPVFMLKTNPQTEDSCIFLKESRCSVYHAKPRTCALYPLGVGPDDNTPEEWLNFIVSKKQHHFNGSRRRVKDWIRDNFTSRDRTFLAADYAYTGEVAGLIKKINRKNDNKMIELILYYKYIAYDISESFIWQYTRNMEHLKQELIELSKKTQL